MKTSKKTCIITTIICLIPIVVAIILYPNLPDEIVIHWGADGEPNGWQSKFVGTIVFPGILVLVNIAMPFLLKLDPKYENMDEKLRTLCQWIIPMVSLFCCGVTLAAAMGKQVRVESWGPAFMGLIFILIGNYLPKTKQSYTMGIKLPWTLNDEDNWNKTHRIAGFLWVAGGIAMILTIFLPFKQYTTYIFSGIVIIMILVPCAYSYLLYRKNK